MGKIRTIRTEVQEWIIGRCNEKLTNIDKIKKWCLEKILSLFIIGMGLLICMPLIILFCGSITDEIEWGQRMQPMVADNQSYITWKWIPEYPTLQNYIELLFFSPDFLVLFWNSIKIAACILIGQLVVGVPAAWSFSVYRFRGKGIIFSVYIILMLLPFQVTMLAKYMVMNSGGMLNTQWAVILPAIFSTFPVFLVYRGFRGIPLELLEVARLDGAGEMRIFIMIALPLARSSITAAFVFSFFEVWNMVEEPLAFLKDMSLWPLSLYLPQIGTELAGRASAASVITLIVSLLVFGIFRDSLEQGIVSSALKG